MKHMMSFQSPASFWRKPKCLTWVEVSEDFCHLATLFLEQERSYSIADEGENRNVLLRKNKVMLPGMAELSQPFVAELRQFTSFQDTVKHLQCVRSYRKWRNKPNSLSWGSCILAQELYKQQKNLRNSVS